MELNNCNHTDSRNVAVLFKRHFMMKCAVFKKGGGGFRPEI